jgi:hypothetical protein
MVIVNAITKTQSAVDPRPKNFLTEAEMGNVLKATRKGRHSIRNFAMFLLTFRHGLRVSELINMRIADVDLDTGRLFVRRMKGSLSTSQPLEGDEIRALRAWLRQRIKAPCCNSPHVFLSERGLMTRQAFNYICSELGNRAGLVPSSAAYDAWVHRLQVIQDLLAQSERFAAFAFEFGANVREVMKEVRLNACGLKVRQDDGRLRSHRPQFNTETELDEEVDAIDDPIGFFLTEPDPGDVPAALAKAFRFDVELLIQAILESLEYWLGSTEYVGPFRWIPSRLTTD